MVSEFSFTVLKSPLTFYTTNLSQSLVFCYVLGTDGILLGAETFRGQYPVDAIKTVGRICAEVRFLSTNNSHHFIAVEFKHLNLCC